MRANTKKRSRKRAAKPPPDLWMFRRKDDSDGPLTDLGCADCRGVLAVKEDSDTGHIAFRCRVGHGYSVQSLLVRKEDALEEALWTAVELSTELAELNGWVAEHEDPNARQSPAGSRRERAQRAARHVEQLRLLLAEEGPVASPKKKRRRSR